MLPVLPDPHLTLREPRLTDADAISVACQDPQSRRAVRTLCHYAGGRDL
jgi:hypothetical protein